MIVAGFSWETGASSSARRQSVNSLTAPGRLENSDNSLAMYTFHPLQVKSCDVSRGLRPPINAAACAIWLSFKTAIFLSLYPNPADLQFSLMLLACSTRYATPLYISYFYL